MNTQDINHMMKSDRPSRKLFIGTFAADEIPDKLPRNFVMCVNTDPSSAPGTHWIGMAGVGSTLYYFDPYGIPPRRGNIRKFASKFRKVYYNKAQHQGDKAITCGGFAIFFMCMIARGKKFREIVSFFNKIKSDDKFIKEFMHQAFNYSFYSHVEGGERRSLS